MSPWIEWTSLAVALALNVFWVLLYRDLRAEKSQPLQFEADILRIKVSADRTLIALEELLGLNREVVEAIRAKDQAQDELWTGSWLPDDPNQAEFERKLKMSEDRAISSSHPAVQYSSRPSPNSPSGSAREPLIRPARRSPRNS